MYYLRITLRFQKSQVSRVTAKNMVMPVNMVEITARASITAANHQDFVVNEAEKLMLSSSWLLLIVEPVMVITT